MRTSYRTVFVTLGSDMWIIFGWEKEERPLGVVVSSYCYDCRRTTEWVVWNESEWVTFSDIRTLRFVNKNRLHCDSCSFLVELTSSEFRKINKRMKKHPSIEGTRIGKSVMDRVEKEQLSTKTPQQLKYIRESMSAIKEYEDRIRIQNERDA